MKKRFIFLFFAVSLTITLLPNIVSPVSAETIVFGTSKEGFHWELDAEGVLTISGEGRMEDYYPAGDVKFVSWLDANLREHIEQIKKVIINPGITCVGRTAFAFCDMTSVVLPDTIECIGDQAFLCCKNLKTIVIPDSVTTIGSAFQQSGLTEITIPSSVTHIDRGAFWLCEDFKTITFEGNPPIIGNEFGQELFEKIAITAYYPQDNPTWTADVMQNYGGILTWVPYGTDENPVQNTDVETCVLCAYASDVDLTVSLGEEMKVSYAMFINGEHTQTWDKPALSIADDDIISVTQCEKNNIGYAVMIKGKKAGGTHLTVTDGDSGASVTIYITVRDTYTTPISYIIDDVPSFTPEISLAKDVQTNIWDCYGLYVNDLPGANEIQKVDGNYLLEFNVYNESSMYGSIDVYDKNKNWIRSYPIEKYTGVQGMYDALEGLQYLVKDTFSGNLLNYTSDSQSAYTRAEISVPEGGYFTISNNYLQSPGAYLYNSIDIIFTGANLSSDMMGFFDEIASQILSNSSNRDKFIRILTEQFGSMALKLSTEVAIEDYGALAKLCHDSFLGIMNELGIDFWGLAELCFNIAEDVLKEFFPEFIEKPLDAIFTIQKITDAICQIDDIKDSPNQPYIIMYTPEAGKGVTTMNGVTVIPGEGVFSDDAVLQVFRISDSGSIVALDSGFVVDQYELYHICYTVDNNKVQPNGNVTIKIPVPATFNRNACDVYHQQQDGSWEIVNSRIEGEFIVFEVDHFSLFAVVNSSKDSSMSQHSISEDVGSRNSGGIGILLSIIGASVVVMLIMVVTAIRIKRKK